MAGQQIPSLHSTSAGKHHVALTVKLGVGLTWGEMSRCVCGGGDGRGLQRGAVYRL